MAGSLLSTGTGSPTVLHAVRDKQSFLGRGHTHRQYWLQEKVVSQVALYVGNFF